MRGENADTHLTVIVRLVRDCALGRTIQYSRDADDRTERPRRTGSSAFAEDDSFGCSRTPTVIASEAKQSIARHVANMDCFASLLAMTAVVV